MIKRFRVPARNQENIFCEFEEEGWPEQNADPLAASRDIDPHSWLHDAIYRRNGCQTNELLRFRGNGNADGVMWERLELCASQNE